MRWLLLALATALAPAHADEALWKAVQGGGHVLFIRHALTTPGFGDPEGFRLEDCATQRNLSEEGRAQAKRLGEALRPRIAAHRGKDNLVLVSHGSTALALSGEHPAMGELLVLKPQATGIRVVGRLALP